MWRGTNPDLGDLQSLTEKFSQRELFSSAQPITVRLRGVMTGKDYDLAFAGGNDLMIVTKFRIGNAPPVERLLFMQSDTDLGWHDDFFNDVIYSTRDFTGERLTLRLQVYDVDNIDEGLVKSVSSVAQQAAGLAAAANFPLLAQFAAASVDFAVGPLVDLVNNLDDHDPILDNRITLEIAEPGTGHKLLQPGYVVYSKNSIDTGYRLGSNLRLRDSNGDEYEQGSYAVLELMREELADRQYEINQKAAKLIAELEGKGQSGQAAVTFLQDTLDVYSKFRKLERAHELQSKEELTDDEKKRLKDLKSNEALKPYLTNS